MEINETILMGNLIENCNCNCAKFDANFKNNLINFQTQFWGTLSGGKKDY